MAVDEQVSPRTTMRLPRLGGPMTESGVSTWPSGRVTLSPFLMRPTNIIGFLIPCAANAALLRSRAGRTNCTSNLPGSCFSLTTYPMHLPINQITQSAMETRHDTTRHNTVQHNTTQLTESEYIRYCMLQWSSKDRLDSLVITRHVPVRTAIACQ
jgi:hypothetical protein